MLVNLAYLLNKPTGTTAYALNLLPSLKQLKPCFLGTPASGLEQYHPVPDNLTAEYGAAGHLRRLLWTQFRLPITYHQQVRRGEAKPLLFSPIPEAPIGSGCRFIVTVHDLIPLRFPVFSPYLTGLYRYHIPQVLTSAKHIICNSQATADDVLHFYDIPAHKVTPILLAYDAKHFCHLELPRKNYFLVLGRHAPYKNVAAAIFAFAKASCKSCELWIAGPCDRRYTPALKAQVAELQLGDRIRFLGYVPYAQLPALLNQALALVFPSLCEGFGLPVVEAMACGTPVIASNLAAIPEVAGDAAMLIDPYSVSSMAAAMENLAKDPPLQRQLSQAGIKQASRFSWTQTGQATAALLEKYL